jgi:hypothetical protein
VRGSAPGSVPGVPGGEKAKRRRKRRLAKPDPPQPEQGATTTVSKPSKDDIARERLEPLGEGERPLAVTIAAVVAVLIALSNLIGWIAGIEINGDPVPISAIALQGGVMLVAAVGMWYGRYWAVLGFQTLLALFIIIVSLALLTAESVVGALLAAALIVAAGTLFWFLVKALARLQMPERRPRAGGR